jgi:hypothetical protein
MPNVCGFFNVTASSWRKGGLKLKTFGTEFLKSFTDHGKQK